MISMGDSRKRWRVVFPNGFETTLLMADEFAARFYPGAVPEDVDLDGGTAEDEEAAGDAVEAPPARRGRKPKNG